MGPKTENVNTLADFYHDIYDTINGADQLKIRGSEVKEIIAPQILLNNPRNRVVYHEDRKWNMHYAMMEALLLFKDVDDVKYFSFINKNMKNYSDDGVTLYGSYGKRIAKYIPNIIEKIKNDKYTRQATITILQNEDLAIEGKDMPCTLSLQFLWRDNKLNMIINMRSNDIIWGLPYDIFMFTVMQEIIANECEMELGWYIHRPASLHLYEWHYELFENVANDFVNAPMQTIKHDYCSWLAQGEKAIRLIDLNRKEELKIFLENI